LAIFTPLSSENESSGKNAKPASRPRLVAGAARLTLAYTILVILFGAVVRITGSGAGCGQHWPSCHGEIVHLPRSLETLIELSHRVTSGGALVAVVILLVIAITNLPGGHAARRAAYAAVAFMLVEALIGAALVLLALVGTDASTRRAVVMPAHLVSTFALTASLALTARWSEPNWEATRQKLAAHTSRPRFQLGLAVATLLLISGTGALTALGDTLYPPSAASLAGRIAEDQGVSATFLQRLRVLHPLIAVFGGAWVARLSYQLAGISGRRSATRAARYLIGFTGVQFLAGTLNVFLSAPGWLQVLHLGLSLGVWLSFVLCAAALLETRDWPAVAGEPVGQGRASG
jgi:heme a synthase